MAWAIFMEPFNYDRRPKQAIAFEIKAGGPQQWPRDVVDAAIAAGKAREARPPRQKKNQVDTTAA